jgi:hypothetical protein
MLIEKFQKIVTCSVETSFKAKWLHWWNAPFRERLANKFSVDKPMNERALDDWLHKASFWAQVNPFLALFIFIFLYSSSLVSNHLFLQLEKEVAIEIETLEESLSVDIDWDTSETIMRPCEYVEHWRIVLWDKAFKLYLGDKPDIAFAKGDNLLEFEEGALAIKRVAYW